MNVISAIILIFGSYFLIQIFQNNSFFRNFVESILKVSEIPGTIVLMLPLGFSIGVIVNLIIHWIDFGRQFPEFSKPILKTLFHTLSSSIIMGFMAYQSLNIFDNVFNLNTLPGIFLQGLLSGIIGIVSAVIVLILLRNVELVEVWNILHKKIWKATPLPPDAELS